MDSASGGPEAISVPTIPEKTSIKYASPPFDDQYGDIILQSSDQVNFRVVKSILRLASSVFADMFSLPQPPPNTYEDKIPLEVPVIQLSESAATLDTVLRLCYPIKRPQLDQQKISAIVDVLRAGLKYNIEVVVEAAEAAFKSRVNASEEDAVVGYAIACSRNRREEAQLAAAASLRWPASGIRFPELSLMTGLHHFDLLDYRQRASSVVENLICGEKFFVNEGLLDADYCRGCGSSKTNLLIASRDALSTVMKRAPLDLEKVTLSTLLGAESSVCSRCKDEIIQRWDDAKMNIIKAIRSEVARIRLK